LSLAHILHNESKHHAKHGETKDCPLPGDCANRSHEKEQTDDGPEHDLQGFPEMTHTVPFNWG